MNSLDLRHKYIEYIKGFGIEIGARDRPLQLNKDLAEVKYVDLVDTKTQLKDTPSLKGRHFIEIDYYADIRDLPFKDESLDFVICNHVLEHVVDPIAAFKEVARVLKMGGIFYFVIPDKRYTFDQKRPRTSLKHLILDYYASSKELKERNKNHLKEWADLVNNFKGDDKQRQIKKLGDSGLNIHWHVWIKKDLINIIAYVNRRLGLNFKIVASDSIKEEFLFILQKG